jgi:peptide/nickel transport system substrate-binding protein
MGDFVMAMIVDFDRGKPESDIFDESEEAGVAAGLVNFKGVEILSEDPLTIAVYSDVYGLDAEHSITTYWPVYGIYEEFAPWHTVAIGALAEANNELAFSKSKSDTLAVEWADYMKGPSLAVLAASLTDAADASLIPYEPTLGAYITPAEADERYANLAAWYAQKEHFWVSCGPFYLQAVYPIGKIVHLKAFDGYVDDSDKWMWLLD